MSKIKMPEYRNNGANGVLNLAGQFDRNNTVERISKDRLSQQNNQFLDRKNQIREIAENRIAAKKPKSTPKQKKVKAPTMDDLQNLVMGHNDIIYGNDLPDQTINYANYFDQNDPSYLEGNESLGEELNYVQNRIWKLQGDKRYVPDYEDTETMNDQEFNDFIGLAEKKSNTTKQKPNKLDKMSDKNFTKILDSKIQIGSVVFEIFNIFSIFDLHHLTDKSTPEPAEDEPEEEVTVEEDEIIEVET